MRLRRSFRSVRLLCSLAALRAARRSLFALSIFSLLLLLSVSVFFLAAGIEAGWMHMRESSAPAPLLLFIAPDLVRGWLFSAAKSPYFALVPSIVSIALCGLASIPFFLLASVFKILSRKSVQAADSVSLSLEQETLRDRALSEAASMDSIVQKPASEAPPSRQRIL